MKFRTASSAATSSRSSAPALGPAPSPFSIPNLPGASSSSAAANKSNLLLASPPPSSTKKKNGGKRSKVRSPMIRSPLGFHKLNNSAHGSDEGSGSISEASGSLSSSGGAGRKLMFSPRKRGGVGAKSNKSKASSSRGGSKSPVKSRDIYSPTPEKHSSATASGAGAIGFRGSISASKVQGSLRKERKRRKSSFAGSTSKASGVAKSVPAIEPASSNEEAGGEDEQMSMHQPEPELKPAAVEFAYPTSDAVAVPGPNVLQQFHQLAVSTSATVQTQTHQAQLDSLGTHLLSLEDVLIPAAAQQENAAIKYHQARLQRDPTANASSIDICKSVRAYILEMASLGATAARANRLEREAAFQTQVAEREAEAQAERRRLRAEARQRQLERKAARAARRQQDRATRRVQDMRALPRNKELYREMAALLKDQNRLQREEKKWEEAGQKLAVQEVEVEGRLQALAAEGEANGGGMEEVEEGGGATLREVEQSRHLAEAVERSTQNAIDDILTSAGRVESTLTEVAALVEESDAVRRELYGKYRTDHQFHGYRGNKNTKGLIVALSQG